MQYILLLTLIVSGRDNTPVMTTILFPDEKTCNTNKELVLDDWRKGGLIFDSESFSPGWKKSSNQVNSERNYSAICLQAGK